MKLDNGAKRKLSKRKDPESALTFYHAEGYPVKSVLDYLMTLLNSNFEEWRMANPTAPLDDFQFTTKKMSTSGCLFDMDKLIDVSKNVISLMSAEEVYEEVLKWSMENDNELYGLFAANPEKAKAILSIGRGGAKPRKDFAIWKEVKDYVAFFYPELYIPAEMKEQICHQKDEEILEKWFKNAIKSKSIAEFATYLTEYA